MGPYIPPLLPADRDPNSWRQIDLAVALLIFAAAFDLWCLLWLDFAANMCSSRSEPCTTTWQVRVVAGETFVGTVAGFIVLLALPRTVGWRRRRWIAVAGTVVFSLQPVYWVFLFGGLG